MGGGDLNMKKSWHPLLLKNQEQVWLKEKQALEEKKKLAQLRKEKEEERQLQELQRLQEEQTGKKRTEKLEWMYATPATGSSQNQNDLEDYLLGKKRVDKILTADENAKIGASNKNFIAVQNANSARDIASKIREDPLLAIKRQEQESYQALMSNPLRLREMQERNGIKAKSKQDKEEKKRRKEEKKRLKAERRKGRADSRDRSRSRSAESYSRRHHSRSPGPSRTYRDERTSLRQDRYSRARSRSRTPERPLHRLDGPSYRNRSPQGSYRRRRDSNSRSPERPPRLLPRSDESDETENLRSRSRNVDRHTSADRFAKRFRSPSPRARSPASKRSRYSPPHPPRQPDNMASRAADDRAARLAAMSSSAQAMSSERQERLAQMLEKEKAELAEEERARARNKGMGGFLSKESKKVFGGSGGLEERIRRGRGGMVVDAD